MPTLRSIHFRLMPVLLLVTAAAGAAAQQSPYNGSPIQLPGTFEAENYDRGGEGVAYHDTTPGNVFGQYRTEDMDVGAIPSSTGHHIGYLAAGEWAEYTVDVPRSQSYEVRLWMASNYPYTSTFHLELDGVNVTGTQTANYSGGWHNYIVKTLSNVWLSGGAGRVLRVSFDAGAWNLDKVEIRGQVPWNGSPPIVPERIQAEHYDLGGEGLAYHDTTPGNVFGAFRNGEDVDVGTIQGGGLHVGYLASGEWTEYTVNVAQTQPYELLMRVASADARTVSYHVELNGRNLTGSQSVPHTGGWHSYITQVVPVGTLSAGTNRVLRVSYDLNAFNLDWLELRAAACAPPAITSHPVSRTVSPGTTVTLSAAASGTEPLSYQWYRNGSPVAGATGSSLSLGGADADDTGTYFARVSNACGSDDSNPATVLLTCGPGELEQTLANVLQGQHVVCPWTTRYSANFPNAITGGSYNIEVLAAAIAAVVDPGMPGPDAQHPGVRGWWRKYLEGELGDRGAEWAFGGKEPFSHIYQHYNIGAVMAVNYQSRQRGWADVRDLARRWLRATFALMGAAAVDRPQTFHDRGTVTSYSGGYSGPWVATGGMRSSWGSWGWSYRNVLFARAVGLPTNGWGEPPYQTSLRLFLEGADNGWSHATEGDVYGLTPSEKSAIAGIKGSDSLPGGFSSWISGIRTIVPYHFFAWDGVRVTLMESNRNGNTTPTYGVAFFTAAEEAGGREAHFLYPWSRAPHAHRHCIRNGSATLDPALTWIEAWSGPVPPFDENQPNDPCTGNPTVSPPRPPAHPEETVRIDGLPGGVPRYQVTLPPYRTNW